MPVLKDIFLNDPSYGATSFVSEWVNFESMNYFVFTTYCDSGVDLRLEYAVDSNYEIIETEIIPLVALSCVQITRPVKTNFVRYSVINVVPPVDLKIQAYFFVSSLGVSGLTNVGSGAELLKSLTEIRSIVSSDSSVSVVQNVDEIDLTTITGGDVTLASAGGVQTLVNDGVGPDLFLKGLTGGGTTNLSSDATSVTISSASTDVSLSSAGGVETLVNDGVGPVLAVKGLTGTGTVSLVSDGNSVSINGVSSDVSLSSAGGVETLVNDGVGPVLVVKGLTGTGTVSLVSDANSVSINAVSSDVTLGSVGGGESVVNDGVGPALQTKSIDGGTGITVTSNASTVTVTNSAVVSPFTQSGQYITPVTLTETSLIGGESNVIDATTRRCIVWGDSNTTVFNSGILDTYGMLACTGCGTLGGGRGNSSGMLFSTDCFQTIAGNNGITENSGMLCSRGCETYDAGGNDRSCKRSGTAFALNCRVGGVGNVTRDSEQVAIMCSQDCVCDNYSGTCCTCILASNSSELGSLAPTGARADMLTLFGCEDCSLGTLDNDARYIDSIFNSQLCQINNAVNRCSIFNSVSSSITGLDKQAISNTLLNCTNSSVVCNGGVNGQAERTVIINGRNSSVRYEDNVIIGSAICLAHKGNLIATDSLTSVTSAANDQCLMKFSGGYTFYSNDSQTTGVQVSAGGGSWASICDVNKKENLCELVYGDVLNKVSELPVYEFNYKGNPSELRNISPTAQDWHKCFPDPVVVCEGEEKPLKDQLVIESQDQIGICLGAIKGLMSIVNKQSEEIKLLKQRVSLLENV